MTRAPGGRLEAVIPPSLDGQRCDRALALLSGLSRSAVADLIAAGRVLVDGEVCRRASRALRAGDVLVAEELASEPAGVGAEPAVAVRVAREARDYLVVDKPAGLVVHPGAGNRSGTLVAGLLARYPEIGDLREIGAGAVRPGIVHRLDKGTSGLLLVARTRLGLASLRDQMAQRAIHRTYLGAVDGVVLEERGVIDAPIGRSPRSPLKMAVRPEGRPAATAYVVVEHVAQRDATILELTLSTGRTHQIRVHLAAIGHPIVSDDRYGRVRPGGPARPFLHAARLRFADPETGETIVVTSPLPADLSDWLPAPVAERLSGYVVGRDDRAVPPQEG